MNVDEAAGIIARYLAGGSASRSQLVEACKVVNADKESHRFFMREFGLGGPPETTCEKFDANVAELAEMSRAQREREMPELARHAEQCARCRRLYWEVRDPWLSEAAATVTAKGRRMVRTLAEGIRLAMDKTGKIVEFGLGPPSGVLQPVAVTAGGRMMGEPVQEAEEEEATDVAGEEREWLLEDEVLEEGDETGGPYAVRIRIRVGGSEGGKMHLWCVVEGPPDSLIKQMSLVVSGRKESPAGRAGGAAYYFKDQLVACQKKAVELPRGEYTIRIEPEGTVSSPTWEIPLSLAGRGAR